MGEAYWEAERIEDAYAYALWQKLLTQNPENYAAKYNIARYFYKKQDHTKVHELALELLEVNQQDEKAKKLLKVANEGLIQEYQKAPQQADEEQRILIAWCLLQNERYEEAMTVA